MVIERVREQRVSLGCGTLILIALIVLIFSGRGDREVGSELSDLRREIRTLKEAVETQTNQIKQLQQQLEKQAARQAPREKQ